MPEDKTNLHLWLKLLVIAVALIGVGVWLWRQAFGTYHFAAVHDGVLYRDGVRDVSELARACRKAGIKTVVLLIDDAELRKEPFNSELAFLTKNNLKLVRLPIVLGGWPDTPCLRRFLDLANDPQARPVLVHCAQGVRRTGMMVAAYQMSVLGYDKEKAKREMLTFGHSQRTVGDVKRFIDAYDPVKREMTAAFATSAE